MSHASEPSTPAASSAGNDPLDGPYVRRPGHKGGTEDAWDVLGRAALVVIGSAFLALVVGYAIWLFVEVNR